VADWTRVPAIASGRLDDLPEFCDHLARESSREPKLKLKL
jgi:hypothetical protein